MNINKILTNIRFDDFITILDTAGKVMLKENALYVLAVLHADKNITSENLTHKLFVYCISKIYKHPEYYHLLLSNDSVFMFCNYRNIINDSILNKYAPLFTKITPEVNTYFLNSMTKEDKDYLFEVHSDFIKDIYRYNEQKVLTDKKFLLEYIHYIRISPVHFQFLTQIYPELIETNLDKITDKQFIKDFYSILIEFNSSCLSNNFLDKYYSVFISGLFDKDFIRMLTSTKILFFAHSFVQKKIRNFLN